MNTKTPAELAALPIPFNLTNAQRGLASARETADVFAKDHPEDLEMIAALYGIAEAGAEMERLIRQRVNARVQVRFDREDELKSNPFRFVINNEDGTQTKGGAASRELAFDHLRKVARENPRCVCWYTGRNGSIANPVRVR